MFKAYFMTYFFLWKLQLSNLFHNDSKIFELPYFLFLLV